LFYLLLKCMIIVILTNENERKSIKYELSNILKLFLFNINNILILSYFL
jgi:hypothetical protein